MSQTRDEDLVKRFLERSAVLRALCEKPAEWSREDLQEELLRSVIALYSAAFELPPSRVTSDREPDVQRVTAPSTVLEGLSVALGNRDTFFEVWDPLERDRPISKSISQELAEIYDDLQTSETLLASAAEDISDQLWEVSHLFWAHWGRHAVSVIRPLHELVASTALVHGGIRTPTNR